MTLLLIAINCWVFFLWQIRAEGLQASILEAGFVPNDFRRAMPANADELFKSMFMHGGLLHLAGNMWFLWLFGNNVEDAIGKLGYLLFYLLCGVAATLCYYAFNSHSQIPLVGASGAISGVLGAYWITWPKARILVLLPILLFIKTFQVPAWFYLLVWIGFQLLSQFFVSGSIEEKGGGVAFMAHIAGFGAGILFMPLFKSKRR